MEDLFTLKFWNAAVVCISFMWTCDMYVLLYVKQTRQKHLNYIKEKIFVIRNSERFYCDLTPEKLTREFLFYKRKWSSKLENEIELKHRGKLYKKITYE